MMGELWGFNVFEWTGQDRRKRATLVSVDPHHYGEGARAWRVRRYHQSHATGRLTCTVEADLTLTGNLKVDLQIPSIIETFRVNPECVVGAGVD